jgi:small subunit ribosomal protein S20
LAKHKSALKRDRQSKARNIRNKGVKSRMKTAIKAVRKAMGEKSHDKAKEALVSTISIIDKAASKRVIHKNTASRKISRLSRQVHAISRTTS